MPPPPSTFHRFYDLPTEIRLQVLSHLTHHPGGHLLGPSMPRPSDSSPAPTPAVAPLSLFLASPALYAEASPLWHSNPLHINLTARTGALQVRTSLVDPANRGLSDLLEFFAPDSLASRLRVRRVVLHLRRIGGFYFDVVGPALAEMVLQGSLRDVEVRIGQKVERVQMGQKWHDEKDDERIAHSEPFQMLLRLLADPYLERAVVLVGRKHWTLWCPFHRKIKEKGLLG